MSMETAFKLFWKRWNDINGRSSRVEFWKAFLMWLIITVIFFGGLIYTGVTINPNRFFILSLFFGFVFWIPAFTLIQRRLQDTGMPFRDSDILIWIWIVLSFLNFIPFVLIISELCFLFIIVLCAFPTDYFINHPKLLKIFSKWN